MNLKFNDYGDVAVDEKGLENVSIFDSEIARFALFFDCRRGGYKYNQTFGNNSNNLVGLSGVTTEDIQLFNEELNNYLESSGLLNDAQVAADFIDDTTIEVVIIGGGSDVTYRYSTSKGRLYKVVKEGQTTQYNYIIHSEDISLTGGQVYDISQFMIKLKEINQIGKYDNIELSYRLIKLMDDTEADVIHSENYYINAFEETLTVEFNFIHGDKVRLQGWPTNMASLESTDNPYLLRRNL